jgi:hypothetical protein
MLMPYAQTGLTPVDGCRTCCRCCRYLALGRRQRRHALFRSSCSRRYQDNAGFGAQAGFGRDASRRCKGQFTAGRRHASALYAVRCSRPCQRRSVQQCPCRGGLSRHCTTAARRRSLARPAQWTTRDGLAWSVDILHTQRTESWQLHTGRAGGQRRRDDPVQRRVEQFSSASTLTAFALEKAQAALDAVASRERA